MPQTVTCSLVKVAAGSINILSNLQGNPEKFKLITMAYEVLGNNKLRKMYDKGILPGGAVEFAHAVEHARQSPSEEGFQHQSERVYENVRWI